MIKINFILSAIIIFCACGRQSGNRSDTPAEESIYPELEGGSIEMLHPELEKVISPEARIEVLADGHEWTEGPIWIEEEQMLLYSDIPRNSIYSWKVGEESKVYLKPSGFLGDEFSGPEPGSNGLLLDAESQLVLCQHGERQIARMNAPISQPEPEFTTIIAHYEGKRLNSPNDAVYKSNGDLYFTDPPYGLPQRMEDPDKELSFQGVYRLDVNGDLWLLTNELTRPNGIAFSPDESILYVANSDPEWAIWMAYDMNKDGSVSNERVFFDATDRVPVEKGLPDGMKVNDSGHLFATGPGGVWIFDSEGKLLGLIKTGQATSNCAFSSDQSKLFITADMYLLRVELE